MQIETVPIESLIEDPDNARFHPDHNIDAIKVSLQQFNQVEPLLVQTASNRVVGGNGRLRAMRELGWDKARIVRLDINDDQARALSIALNRTAELAEWDYQKLFDILKNLPDTKLVEVSGFTDEEIRSLAATDWVAGSVDPTFSSTTAKAEPIHVTFEQRRVFERVLEHLRASDPDLTEGEAIECLAHEELERSEGAAAV